MTNASCFPTGRPKRQDKKKEEKKVKEEKKEKKVIDNTGRHKPFGLTAWAPVDDVYLSRYYPRPSHGAAEAVDMLKSFQKLDLTPPHQSVYIELKLDMKLEKKVIRRPPWRLVTCSLSMGYGVGNMYSHPLLEIPLEKSVS